MNTKDLGIYIHIPFCVQKCAYCDFLSFSATEEIKEQYAQKLIQEIRTFHNRYMPDDYRVKTVFFGGGTPSIMPIQAMDTILKEVKNCFSIEEMAEISLEANPGTVTKEKLSAYRNMGFNRISFGLQSTKDEELRRLGRIHTYEQFLQGYEEAREVGFKNINVDLISAIPGQNAAQWIENVRNVTSLQPEHISCYSLIIEEGTPFFEQYAKEDEKRSRGEETELLPTEEEEREMYFQCRDMLMKQGYLHYEISNYAKPGFICRHNDAYWTRKNYIGFGLGAASLMENERFSNTDDLKQYMELDFDSQKINRQPLNVTEQMEEYMFLGLRRMKGISKEKFFHTFAVDFSSIYGTIYFKLKQEGLLEEEGDRIRLTDKGISLSNYVMAQFLIS